MKFILFLLFFISESIIAQSIDTLSLKKQLSIIFERDQKTRTRGDSAAFMQEIDRSNLKQIEKIIAQYGWPGKSFVGKPGNTTIFLVIQHSELAIQEKYLPLLQASVAANESDPGSLALMQDRILMQQGKKQIYGSQIERDSLTGGWKIYPIEDEMHVDQRRAKIKLETIEEYARRFGIQYVPPKNN